MSFLINSVIGIGLAASGEIYLVKIVTASCSIPGVVGKKETKSRRSERSEILKMRNRQALLLATASFDRNCLKNMFQKCFLPVLLFLPQPTLFRNPLALSVLCFFMLDMTFSEACLVHNRLSVCVCVCVLRQQPEFSELKTRKPTWGKS